jgi:hypothetical protein
MNDQRQDSPIPAVRSISALLASHAQERLVKLRKDFPESSDLFNPNYRLGPSTDVAPSQGVDPRRNEALRALARDGLNVANTRIEKIIHSLSRRMKFARRIKLGGSIIAALSGAGVISALAISRPIEAAVSAALGFASSISSLIGEHFEQPLVGGQKSVGEYMQQILNAEKDARSLDVLLHSNDGDPVTLAEQVNQIASTVRAVEIYSGLS